MVPSPRKLAYTVVSCSGEDPAHPASNLLSDDGQVSGWHTPRYCQWPQELMLRLEGPADLHQIQMLCHEYKIASKVELHVGMQHGDTVSWKRLGSFSFDSNERSKLQSRELKSVTVSVQALFLRIVLARCHINSQNIYKQAAILGLSINGSIQNEMAEINGERSLSTSTAEEEAAAKPRATQNGHASRQSEKPAQGSGVDAKTAARLRELEAQKAAAVRDEDYDEAKRLKLAIDGLRKLTSQLAELEARKRAAVDAEDYDAAKELKRDIERIRLSTDGRPAASRASPPLSGHGSRSPAAHPEHHAEGDATQSGTDRPNRRSSVAGSVDSQQQSPGNHVEADASPAGRRSTTEARDSMSGRRVSSTPSQAYDERPAVAAGSSPAAMQAAPAPARRSARGSLNDALSASSAADTTGRAPPGWPGDLAPPEAMSAADAKDASELAGVLEEYVLRCLFSKNWQLREAALQYIERQLSGDDLTKQAKQDLARCLGPTFSMTLMDKVPGVYLASVSLLKMLAASSILPAKECSAMVAGTTPALIEKAGENNARVQSAAVDALLNLAAIPDAALSSQAPLFLRPEKQTQWKRVLGRLTLLEALIPLFGVGKGDGYGVEQLMQFVGKAFSNSNADVRAAATRVTVLVHGKIGNAVKKQLPPGLNPKILEQLEASFGGPPGRAASPPLPAVAKRMSASSTPKQAPAPAPRNTAPAVAQSSGKKAPTNSRAKPASSQPSKVSKAAAAAPVTVQASAHANSKYTMAPAYPVDVPIPAASMSMSEEEAFHLMELQQREALYGPHHPNLADSLSNLAILYNQSGEYDKAQPLYERALQIYQTVHGPDHPDVAHTLTDLAVLHLEQGHEEQGRPLLERALVIQEAALGPDHPDVQAIRDVLEGED
ncbi:g1780 [Coccomyxa viridis]|uniref:G1780 protein n=1 Tax=Coccomyxa viridis TaxID=1274662 RepID=A0ABP1FP78_9CHLO